ncbi:MAG: PIN domain-containing protein [Proteocatella sp.]
MKKIFIIDYENTSIHGLLGMDRLDENSIVRIHCSKENLCELFDSIFGGYRKLGVDVRAVYSESRGKNALDFKLACDLGYFSSDKEVSEIYIISKDKGLESAIIEAKYLNSKLKSAIKENILECISKNEKAQLSKVKQIDQIFEDIKNDKDIPEKYKSHLLATIKKSNSEKEFRDKAISIFGKKQEKLVDIATKYFSKYIKSLL